MSKVLLTSVKDIIRVTRLHGNVDEHLIVPEILLTQDMYMEPILGTALLKRLLEGIDQNNLTAKETDLLDDYIIKCHAYYTLQQLPEGLSMQLFNIGAVTLTSEASQSNAASDLLKLSRDFKYKAEFYAGRLTNYLQANASASLFSEYLNPGSGGSIKPDDNPYTCPIFLG